SQAGQYNYLQNSIIPTYHFQKSLQKLKIPKLDDTFDRYFKALKPLLSTADFDKAKQIGESFHRGEAIQLDKEVRELDARNKNSNYISEPWFDMYLSARESIVLNYNPFITFAVDPNPQQMDQAIRASNFLISSARFMNSLRNGKLKPEIFHLNPKKSDTVMFERLMRLLPESVSFYGAFAFNAYPLDMSQYFRLFNSTRIPRQNKDELLTDSSKNHMLVLHKGNFYTFPVFDDQNNIYKPEEIYAFFSHILNSGDRAEFPLGALTAEDRNTWASVREHLEKLGNKEALDQIDTALFCIALDDCEVSDPTEMSHEFLYGDPANRWFDKSNTVIINKNGHAAVNFEHSWGDGVAVLRFFNEVYDDTVKNGFVNAKTRPSFDRGEIKKFVTKLEFKLNDEAKKSIRKAEENYRKATGGLNMRNFEQDSFGRLFVKNFGLSPDSVMQSGIQVAFYKVFKKFVATYESASTSAFKYGRTETIRPASMATKRLAEYLDGKKISDSNVGEVISMMQECSKYHNKLVKEGAMGQGFDRHLFALKYHAVQRKKQSMPEFFNSHAYKFINHNILSTSTLAYPNIMNGGFAPVVPDGFGIGYRILDKKLGACVSSYSLSELNEFVDALEETYDQFHDIMKKAPTRKNN
ncbi:carnitine O-palmitoyltransferase mitochondrial, partial [Brachionus plicatilis]